MQSALPKFRCYDSENIDTLKQYIELLNKIPEKESYYRGFCVRKQIYSTYLRDKIDNKKPELVFKNYNPANNYDELEYIRKFEDIESQWMQDFNNPVDLVATAQHRGLKTRFKDWTTSFLIATLFALRNKGKDKYYIMEKNNRQFVKVKTLPYQKRFLKAKNVVKYQSQMELYRKICFARNSLWNRNQSYLISEWKSVDNNHEADDITINNKLIKDKDWNRIYRYFKIIFKETNPRTLDNYVRKYSMWFLYGEKLLIESKISNDKIANQKGLFELEDYDIFYGLKPCEQLRKRYDSKDQCFIYIIDGKIRDEIILYIAKLGISFNDLMRSADETTSLINDVICGKLPKYL